MAICTYEELGTHEANGCVYPKGGISAYAVLKADALTTITDFTDETMWVTAILAGDAVVVTDIKAELPAASPAEGENPVACGSETILDGLEWTFSVKDFNVSTIDKSLVPPAPNNTNDEFYNILNRSQFSALVLYYCEQDEIRVIIDRVSFAAFLISPLSNKEKQYYQVTAKWYQSVNASMPVLYDAPLGIFS